MAATIDRLPHYRAPNDPPGYAWYSLSDVLEANERELDLEEERLAKVRKAMSL